MAALTTIAALALAGAALGSSVAQGEQARRAQKRALADQQEAQRQATAAATKQQRDAAIAERRATARTPDVSTALAANTRTTSPSLLSGALGVDSSLLSLGKTKLLGE